MGYDLMGTTEKTCPCGESVTIESRYMDDWNRTKSVYEMVCETCRQEYTHQEGHWVKIEDWQKKVDAIRRYKKKKLSIDELAAEELADEWYQYFAHIKTKKAFYLAMAEKTGASLTNSRFNSEVARKSMDETIKHLFNVTLRYTGTQDVTEKISSENPLIVAELKELDKLLAKKKVAENEFRTKLH
ncbi:MAG: hypothetical protein ACQEV0_14980 [Bacillota bacterium]